LVKVAPLAAILLRIPVPGCSPPLIDACEARADYQGEDAAAANAQANPNDRNFGQAEKQELLTLYHAAGDTFAFPGPLTRSRARTC
jgi:hypothetical protein